jgi:hypothetical protein
MLGLELHSLMTVRTRWQVSSLPRGEWLITREAVERDTPLERAMFSSFSKVFLDVEDTRSVLAKSLKKLNSKPN